MPEIGATLREARMRARIDISEIEAETKIRAKYLRALENEEWGLLPGPTYVRSFLRTYAEALDLDAKLILEEYKLRHERPSDHDLMPIGPPRRHQQRGRGRGGGRGIPPWAVVGVLVAGLLIALFALGTFGSDTAESPTTPAPARTDTTTTTPVPRTRTATTTRRTSTTAASTSTKQLVRLQIVPTGTVSVCLRAAGRMLLLPGVTLHRGQPSPTYRRSGFFVRLGNGNVRLKVNGTVHTVAKLSPVAYQITRSGHVQRVRLSKAPTCVA
jgi:cytoskeletal protein RodZ